MLSGTDRKILLFLLLVFCFSFGQVACGQQSVDLQEQDRIEQIAKHEEAAKQLRIKGEFQSALQEQQKAVELNPDDSESLRLLGGIYVELKQWDKAIEVLEKGKKINQNNAGVHYELSWALDAVGKKDKFINELKEAVRLAPTNVIYLTNLGVAYGSINNTSLEREAYNKALEIDPNYPTAMYNLALLEADENNKTKAIDLLNKMLQQLSKTNDEDRIERVRNKISELEKSKQ